MRHFDGFRAGTARGITATLLTAALAFPAAAGTTLPIGSKERRAEPIPAGEKIELTLDRAVTLALQNALDLDVSSYGYERAGYGILAAEGIFDPTLEVDLQATSSKNAVFSIFQAAQTRTQSWDAGLTGLLPTGASYSVGWTNSRRDAPIPNVTIGNPTYSSGLSASFTQPLLRNFGTTVSRRLVVQARIARDQSAWDFVRVVEGTIQSVANAYWDLAYALANLESKREALDRARDLNRITKIKIDVGALAPIDIVQTEVTIAQREQDIILSEGAIGDAQDRLRRLLNVASQADWARPIIPTDAPSDAPFAVDLDAGIRLALQTRPEVKQAVADIESKKVSFVYGRNQVQPRLDLSGSYGPSAQALQYADALYSLRSNDYPAWTVGLTVAVPIFNRAARGSFASARTDLELARTSLELLKQNLQVEVRAAARGIDTAYRSILAARKGRELAERNLDAERKKFENGMSTSFTVAQIQNDLTNARSFELQAVAAYQKVIEAWHTSIGDNLSVRGVTISGLPVTTEPTPPEEGGVKVGQR